MEDDKKKEEKINIEIVTDDDSDLDISDVYDHLNLDRVRNNPEKKDIVIPGIKKEDSELEKEKEEESNEDTDN